MKQHRAARECGHNVESLFQDVDEYDKLLRQHLGIALANATVFEIGFGARPYRQMILQSMEVDVRGVDAEVPILAGRLAEYWAMLQTNGFERFLKSVLRHAVFDRSERRAITTALLSRGLEPRLEADRLTVNDAGLVAIEPDTLDLVFSEDVFEHISRKTLEHLVPTMAAWLRPGGLALIRPNVFTGIIGGHLIEWSSHAMRHPPPGRKSEPWEHLRQRRFRPNTYLNELTRAEYRDLFSRHFQILEERVSQPHLGEGYLDERARKDLANWSEEELFSNQVLFVLRRL
jgi:hypothetical protein